MSPCDDHPPSKLKTSRLPLPCNSVSALSFTICFATDVATLLASRRRTKRGLLPVSPKYSSIRDGMNFETPWKSICRSDGDPNTSFLLPRNGIQCISIKGIGKRRDWHHATVWTCKSAFVVINGAETDIESSWIERDDEKGNCVPCIGFTFSHSIQSCAGKPSRNIEHYWWLLGVTDDLHPFVAHL